MKQNDWIKVAATILTIVLLLIGFLIGYYYEDEACVKDPLSYGIKIFNEVDNDYFTCSCASEDFSKQFYFNEDEIEPGSYIKNLG